MALDERSSSLRARVLAPSGGWLGEGTMIISDLLGLWDIFVLMTFFVVFWVVIRTAIPEIALPLGLIFDLGIPLQYQNHDGLKDLHKKHLSGYWPIWVIGTAVEAGAFLMLLPDMFTLIVCLKTTVCTCLWLSRQADGLKVRFGSGSRRKVPTPATRRSAVTQPSSTRSSKAGTSTKTSKPKNEPGSEVGPSPSANELRARAEKHYPGIEKSLQAAGWDYLTREGMMGHFLAKIADKKQEEAFKDIERWCRPGKYSQAERAARTESMTKRALKRRNNHDGATGGERPQRSAPSRPTVNHPIIPRRTAPTGGRKTLAFSNEQLSAIKAWLKRVQKMSRSNIAKVLDKLQKINDPDEVKEYLASVGILTPDGTVTNLHEQIPLDVQKGRYQRLTRGEHDKDGLGLPTDMANLMMLDMMNQPTVKDADRLYDSWKQIRAQPPAERLRLRNLLRDHYEELLDLPKGATYLRMPWQGKDRDA